MVGDWTFSVVLRALGGLLLILAAIVSPAFAAQLILEGELTQGGIIIGSITPSSKLSLNGNPIRISPAGKFVIGFHRDAKLDAALEARFPDGSIEQRTLKLTKRDYQVQRIDGLPSSKVSPSEADMIRIRAEYAITRKARKIDSARTNFTQIFQWPLIGPITGVYGSQRILNGQPRRPHYGVDIAAPTGTPVMAPAGGVVTVAHPDMFFSGGTMMIDHGHGLSSTFLHLNELLAEVGQEVRQGEVVARVGATGRVTGPHLDWRMNWFKARVDPTLLVGPMPVTQ